MTPLMRAYKGDKVQIRALVGAHQAPHSFNLHGLKWPFEPDDPNSGYRSTQGMAISEHYEMLFDLPRAGAEGAVADYLYVPSSGSNDLRLGNWGILRAYGDAQTEEPALQALPNNPVDGPIAAAPSVPTRRRYGRST